MPGGREHIEPTTANKAAAFDALVKALQGRHIIDHYAMHHPNLSASQIPHAMAREAHKVPVYRWELLCKGNSDIEQALLDMLPPKENSTGPCRRRSK